MKKLKLMIYLLVFALVSSCSYSFGSDLAAYVYRVTLHKWQVARDRVCNSKEYLIDNVMARFDTSIPYKVRQYLKCGDSDYNFLHIYKEQLSPSDQVAIQQSAESYYQNAIDLDRRCFTILDLDMQRQSQELSPWFQENQIDTVNSSYFVVDSPSNPTLVSKDLSIQDKEQIDQIVQESTIISDQPVDIPMQCLAQKQTSRKQDAFHVMKGLPIQHDVPQEATEVDSSSDFMQVIRSGILPELQQQICAIKQNYITSTDMYNETADIPTLQKTSLGQPKKLRKRKKKLQVAKQLHTDEDELKLKQEDALLTELIQINKDHLLMEKEDRLAHAMRAIHKKELLKADIQRRVQQALEERAQVEKIESEKIAQNTEWKELKRNICQVVETIKNSERCLEVITNRLISFRRSYTFLHLEDEKFPRGLEQSIVMLAIKKSEQIYNKIQLFKQYGYDEADSRIRPISFKLFKEYLISHPHREKYDWNDEDIIFLSQLYETIVSAFIHIRYEEALKLSPSQL